MATRNAFGRLRFLLRSGGRRLHVGMRVAGFYCEEFSCCDLEVAPPTRAARTRSARRFHRPVLRRRNAAQSGLTKISDLSERRAEDLAPPGTRAAPCIAAQLSEWRRWLECQNGLSAAGQHGHWAGMKGELAYCDLTATPSASTSLSAGTGTCITGISTSSRWRTIWRAR